ncbi:MAG: RDD family protein [Dehalococcoidia bacterium]|nr:RDD family protein [Dehalococcoidia bacterium]MCK6563847.1 RDD family protein [Dehalococcoidia bacterium]MCK6563849.1 RDD family protein [Dehalococcoidia bacterium]MCK6563851.1 RDD family protein [Dehalococcoidia bacterium]MCL4231900.1 RDD family protein [Dehalococcoidia bacterium]
MNDWQYHARRVGAFSVDAILIWLLIALWGLVSREQLVVVNAAIYLVYRCGLTLATPWGTLGRAFLRLRVEALALDSAPSVAQVLGRELPIALVLVSPIAISAVGLGPGLAIFLVTGQALLVGDLAVLLLAPGRRSMRDRLAGTAIRPLSAPAAN